ncbi:MAG: hypothetical protein V2A73_13290 [Pseudomonadota bacterium]
MSMIRLDGLGGDNPLAFMAALGVLVTVDRQSEGKALLHWERVDGSWNPRLTTHFDATHESLVDLLYRALHREEGTGPAAMKNVKARLRAAKAAMKKAEQDLKQSAEQRRFKRGTPEYESLERSVLGSVRAEWEHADADRRALAEHGGMPDETTSLGPNLKVPGGVFGAFTRRAADAATPQNRRTADFAAAFGCEAIVDKYGVLEPTRLSKQNGNSGKNMLADVARLMTGIRPDQIASALFEKWSYADEKLSLGWDPQDVRAYALMADDPGETPSVTMHGANLVAYEALVLFPVSIRGRRLVTTGTKHFDNGEYFTWPIWSTPIGVDVARSLLAYPELQRPAPNRTLLGRIGVVEIYRAAHFSWNKSPRFRFARPA